MDIREQFAQLDLRKSIFIGLGLVVFYYLLAYDDGSKIERTINQLKGQIATQQSSLKKVQQALADKKKFEDDIRKIDLNMKDFNRYFTNPMTILDISAQISKYAEMNQLVIDSLKPASKDAEFPDYPEVRVDFVVEGNYHRIMKFVGQLTQMNKAIDFSTMEFSTVNGGDFPVIRLKTTLVVYSSQEEDLSPKADQSGVGNG